MLEMHQYADCYDLLEDIFGMTLTDAPREGWQTPVQELHSYNQFKNHLFSHEGGQESIIVLNFEEDEASFNETGLTYSCGQRRNVKHADCEHLTYPEYNRCMYEWCTVETYEIVQQWAKKNGIIELEVKIWW
jgi:hypothetical protein